MYIQKFQNSAGSKITVTSTATNIFDLINTAQSTTLKNAGFSSYVNGIIIQPEGGEIRLLFHSSPTSANGFLISSGTVASLPNIPLNDLQLIAVGSNVVCSIQVGICDQSETINITGSGSSGGEYNTTSPTLTNGQTSPTQMDSMANILISQGTQIAGEDLTNDVLGTLPKLQVGSKYAPTRFQNLGANATLNVKAVAGNVFALTCHNINAAARYLQLHNTATTPSAGAVPLYTFHVPAASSIVLTRDFFMEGGAYFSTGIAFAFSTTETTYTAGVATDQVTQIHYI